MDSNHINKMAVLKHYKYFTQLKSVESNIIYLLTSGISLRKDIVDL